jgi:hypothetical protein
MKAHQLGMWVGGTPNLLSLPVMNFHASDSAEARTSVKLLHGRSEEELEVSKLRANIWAAHAIKDYDEWWDRCLYEK